MRDFGTSHAAIIAERRESVPAIATPAARQQAAVAPPVQNSRHDAEIELADLFFSAEPAERRILLMSLGSIEAETPQAVQPIETNRALEAAALGRDPAGFTRLLENALGLTHEQAERIVADPSGEPLLIAAKALAMPSVALQRILMFIDPAIGESVQRVFDLAGLYERISADAAHKIVASLRGREPVQARRPAHKPMYYDDEAARSRRGSAIRRPGRSRAAGSRAHRHRRASTHDVIEKVPPAAVLDLDDPEVRIEAALARQIRLDVRLRCR